MRGFRWKTGDAKGSFKDYVKDAAFNLFFWSNTYATAFGAMNIDVGDARWVIGYG